MEKLLQYEEKLAEAIQEWGEDALLVFRGHANEEWHLDSSAERRLRELKVKPGLIEYLEKSLLEPASHEGYGRQQNKELNDLELLAALQHNGAATCLIDFTANFHIGLWFACQDEDHDGKVFVVNRGDIHTFEEVTPERANKGIKELLQRRHSGQYDLVGKQQKVYYWQPSPNENRIIVQHSCFLFSPRPIEKGDYKEIIISKVHKKEIQSSLQRYYDLEEQTIFRDFTGFARSQSQLQPISYNTGEQWFRSGNIHFQQGEFEAAIADFDTALQLNSQYAPAHFHRGIAKVYLRREKDAIVDFDEALRLNPQDSAAYLGRGIAKANLWDLQRLKEAITDYDMAIGLNPQNALAYHCRGGAKHRLNRNKEAIADLDEALRLNPRETNAYIDRGDIKVYLWKQAEARANFSQLELSGLVELTGPVDPEKREKVREDFQLALKLAVEARADFQHALELAEEQSNKELAQLAQERLSDTSGEIEMTKIRINQTQTGG